MSITNIGIDLIGIGIQGPPGDTGPQGPAGGLTGSYEHSQPTDSLTWVVIHNLGYRPAIRVFNEFGVEMYPEVTHDSINQTTLTFLTARQGYATAT